MIVTSSVHPAAPQNLAPPLRSDDVDRLADEIAEVASHIDAAEHRLLTLIRRFDEGSGWATHGALSCAHWLNWRIGLDLGAARERVRVARAIGSLPLVDGALRRGAISYSKVRAITRVASAATEETLLEMATHATASQLERICRGYRRVAAAEAGRPESLADEERSRFVRVRDTHDGMVRIEARLRPEEAAVVLQALEVARRRAWRSAGAVGSSAVVACDDRGDLATESACAARGSKTETSAETSPNTQRADQGQRHHPSPALSRADALVAVAKSWLASVAARADGKDPAGLPVELVVHVDHAALKADGHGVLNRRLDPDEPLPAPHATLANGTALALATAPRLACDASVVLVDDARETAGAENLPSRRTRRISARLRRALRLRDDGCRFPGCTNRHTDAHHVVAWIDGGATRLSNLLSLCRRHHRFVHENGYQIVTAPPREPCFFRPDGQPVPLADEELRTPLGRDLPAMGTAPDAVAALRAAHAARGLEIDATTAFPRWDGEPLDAHLAVQALLAHQASPRDPTSTNPMLSIQAGLIRL